MLVTKNSTDISEIVKQSKLQHIAIIMDGNRRWAKERNLPSAMGHKKGVDALKSALKASHDFNLKYLTLYTFSTENWNRSEQEVEFLMGLLLNTIKSQLKELNEANVKLRFIGDLSRLNSQLQEVLKEAIDTTCLNTGVNLQIALNYGSRDEIKNAVKNIIKDGVKEEEINEELISNYLYTKDIPDPDLLIRTGGAQRISNYLLWQIAYSEIIILDSHWPDFSEDTMRDSILEFAKRQRRYGA